MKKLRVLLLTHYFFPNIGGIETVSRLLAEGIANQGHDIIVVTWSKNTSPDKFPFKVVRNPNILGLIKYFLWAQIIIENNPCLRLSWPGFIFRRPNIIVLQTWLNHSKQKTGSTEKLKLTKLALADKVIAVSNAVKEKIWPSAIVINNPYDENVFGLSNALSSTRRSDFVFSGRLVSDKGGDYVIKVMHRLIHYKKMNAFLNQKPLLTIIGDGKERKNLEQLVTDLQIEDYVYFTGALHGREIAEELHKHKYLLVPSLWEEPFGIVALEGMACGCIPLVSKKGGLPEAVGSAGIIFENDNPDSLIAAICNIENNIDLQLKLRESSTEHLRLHSTENIVAGYLRIIKQIVRKK